MTVIDEFERVVKCQCGCAFVGLDLFSDDPDKIWLGHYPWSGHCRSLWGRIKVALKIIFRHRDATLWDVSTDREELFSAVEYLAIAGRELENKASKNKATENQSGDVEKD